MTPKSPRLLDLKDLKVTESLIEETKCHPFQYLEKIRDVSIQSYTIFTLSEIFKDGLGKIYVIPQDGGISGLITWKLLPWDEQIFKIKMATIPHLLSAGDYKDKFSISTILSERVLKDCRDSGVKHLSVRIDSRDTATIHALEECGFRLMDVLIIDVIETRLSELKELSSAFQIRKFREEDVREIVEIARRGFKNYIDRFHLDPILEQQHCDTLYAEWARNSCRGYADEVFVAESEEKVLGFNTIKFHKDVEKFTQIRVGEYELVATHPEARRLGVFPNIVDHAWNFLVSNADVIMAKTLASNFRVLRSNRENKMNTVQSQLTFHMWLG